LETVIKKELVMIIFVKFDGFQLL